MVGIKMVYESVLLKEAWASMHQCLGHTGTVGADLGAPCSPRCYYQNFHWVPRMLQHARRSGWEKVSSSSLPPLKMSTSVSLH